MRGMGFLGKKITRVVAAVMCAVVMSVTSVGNIGGIPETVVAADALPIRLTASISGANVVIRASAAAAPANSDGLYHLYAENVYDAGITGTEVAQAAAGTSATFTVALNNNSAGSMLYKKFVVAVMQNGVPVQASNAAYITNPEAVANHTQGRIKCGKKGIIPAAEIIHSGDIVTLGVDQVSYNILMSQLLSANGGQTPYTYNGKTYHFSNTWIAQYDWLVSYLTSCGISTTMVLLNDWHADLTSINPLSRSAGHQYYAYNAADQAGVELLAAIGSFIASRYSNQGHGQIDNFVIGNEINARALWNYMNKVDSATYAVQNANAFRVFYNAIKSTNANANVYFCIDQMWGSTNEPNKYYAGKELLDIINGYIAAEGNIDWGVAAHPYNVPLTNAYAWNTSSKYINHTSESPYLTMQNIEVLTDYMCQPQFRNPKGEVRSIAITEVGYTSSTAGQTVQAASITYAYEMCMANQHIDAFIYNKEMDHAVELAQNLALGLIAPGGGHKQAYTYYQNLDGPNAQQYRDAAAATIGVTDLKSILIYR